MAAALKLLKNMTKALQLFYNCNGEPERLW